MDYNENKLQKLGIALYNLIEINFLWLIFTFLGLFIFGIFPSITAAFDTYTKYSNNKKINIFQTFKNSYKNLFISSNIIGFIFSFILSIILIDYFYFLNITNVFSIIFSYVLLLIFLMFSFSLVFLIYYIC